MFFEIFSQCLRGDRPERTFPLTHQIRWAGVRQVSDPAEAVGYDEPALPFCQQTDG